MIRFRDLGMHFPLLAPSVLGMERKSIGHTAARWLQRARNRWNWLDQLSVPPYNPSPQHSGCGQRRQTDLTHGWCCGCQ